MSSRTISKKTLNGGLTSESTIVITYVDDVHNDTVITVNSDLPPCLSETYWQRHLLTLRDINTVVSTVASDTVWLVCMLDGIDVASGSVKTSFDCCEGLLISGKTTAIKKLLKLREPLIGSIDVIDDADLHQPPLPRHFIGEHEMKTLATIICGRINCLTPEVVPGVFAFLECLWIPTNAEGVALVLYRLSEIKNFTRDTPVLYRPLLCQYNNIVYGLTDEVIRVFA